MPNLDADDVLCFFPSVDKFHSWLMSDWQQMPPQGVPGTEYLTFEFNTQRAACSAAEVTTFSAYDTPPTTVTNS